MCFFFKYQLAIPLCGRKNKGKQTNRHTSRQTNTQTITQRDIQTQTKVDRVRQEPVKYRQTIAGRVQTRAGRVQTDKS